MERREKRKIKMVQLKEKKKFNICFSNLEKIMNLKKTIRLGPESEEEHRRM